MNLFLISHFYNEELMLPGFCEHHKNLVDGAIMINHHSTDNSVDTIKSICPEWQIVDSKLSLFDAYLNDLEVMEWEKTLPEGLKITLNVTEWIFDPLFKEKISNIFNQNPGFLAVGMKSFVLIDNGLYNILKIDRLTNIKYHHWGYADEGVTRRFRFVHKAEHGYYQLGRHGVNLPSLATEDIRLLYWAYAPWPQCKQRKLQIQTRIPEYNKQAKLGWEHVMTEEELEQKYYQELNKSYNLLNVLLFKENYNKFINE